MNGVIHTWLVVEDLLSEAVVRRILRSSHFSEFQVVAGYKRTKTEIRDKLDSYKQAAEYSFWIVVTDLDQAECVPTLRETWLPKGPSKGLVFCIAVREVEAWLLADRVSFAEFLSVPTAKLPVDVESIPNPKQFIIGLARNSRASIVQRDLVPASNSTARVGGNYNGRLIQFVNENWDYERARQQSTSLNRFVQRLENRKLRMKPRK